MSSNSPIQQAIKNTAKMLGIREGKLIEKHMPKVGEEFVLGEFVYKVTYIRANPVRISAEPVRPK